MKRKEGRDKRVKRKDNDYGKEKRNKQRGRGRTGPVKL